ncbi:hypothetical protein KCH_17590 [Kitasatospora cheerisanensis KCTC 2395]|uniref:Uncharacterized protein n=1 Tax=Kitasatospora cheerisanensis KCTC 2395 TaxID=1348663 RepID=A0A066YZ09_9ACTN|nr:hypothetical protein KCH_17590 [Kitasatospora cheerisanensis KCTC 2395]
MAPPRTGAWRTDGQWRARDGCGAHAPDRRTLPSVPCSRMPTVGGNPPGSDGHHSVGSDWL